uniref:Amine oxidase domain-containing protein n=1 Tax=Neogobius melanostomus TaxID=47308 RepID=A0A8C6TV93_9GOBI
MKKCTSLCSQSNSVFRMLIMGSMNPGKIQRDAKVLIVGSGIAGISAALKLNVAGFKNVHILEATGRSGGRIKTGKMGMANWIHGPSEENPVFCLARQYGLLDPEALTPENQAMDVAGHPPWVPNFFTNNATRSLGFSVVSNILKVECCVNGTHSMDAVGLSGLSLYKTLPGLDCTFPKSVSVVEFNECTHTVTYNCPVRCIEWNNTEAQSTVKVECEDGTGMTADHVIVTVSLGYLKKHHSAMFSPPLPLHKLQSIQRQGFGTNNKIYVEFDSPWWDADCEVIYFLWEDEVNIPSSWIKKLFGFTVLKPTER